MSAITLLVLAWELPGPQELLPVLVSQAPPPPGLQELLPVRISQPLLPPLCQVALQLQSAGPAARPTRSLSPWRG